MITPYRCKRLFDQFVQPFLPQRSKTKPQNLWAFFVVVTVHLLYSVNPMPVIQVNDLSKSYKTYKKRPGFWGAIRGLYRRDYETVDAAKGISFSIEQGELVGFLGPNGAGKTTTLKMLSGLLFPTSGNASVLGYTPWERNDNYRRQFALLLGQKNQLWWDLPARESLELNARIYGIPREQFEETVDELTQLLDVAKKLNISVRELSLGERMKMELIASLLHRPKVLFLDEPTIGLDVVSQKTVREFLKDYNAREKTTIMLTSHYMADIQELCKRVIIIDHGTIFFDGPLHAVMDRFADFKLITIHCEGARDCPQENLTRFGEIVEQGPGTIQLRVKRDKVIPTCKALLDELPVHDIDIKEVPIEDIVRRIFSGENEKEISPSNVPAAAGNDV